MNTAATSGLVTVASTVAGGARIAFVTCDGVYYVSAVRGENELYAREFSDSARAVTAYARLERVLRGRAGRFASANLLHHC